MHRRRFLQGALAGATFAAPMIGPFVSLCHSAGLALAQHRDGCPVSAGRTGRSRGAPCGAGTRGILGKSVVVDNRSGAGGMVGNAFAARAEPDGHTLLMALSSMMFLPEAERLYHRKPSYELDQFSPIARVLADPAMLCVRSDARWKTVADLVADAKKRPGEISFGSSGNYGAAHVPFEMFQQAADIKLLHVPYRGGGPALTAFLGKQVDITAQAPGPITPHVQGGAARLLANWGSKRAAEYPDVPTFIEIGYEEVEYYIWAGLFVPMGTSAPVIARLRDAMREVMKNPQVTDVFVKAASPPAYLDQPEFQAFVDADAKRLIPVVRKIGRLDEK